MIRHRSRLLAQTVLALALGSLVVLPGVAPVTAQAPDVATLTGGWRVSFGPETPPEEFITMLFNEGGTATFMTADGDRGQGVWKKLPGRGTFAATFDEFDNVDSDNPERFRIRATIQLLDRNNFSATLTIDQMSADGTVVLEFEGSGAVEGTRMLVVLE